MVKNLNVLKLFRMLCYVGKKSEIVMLRILASVTLALSSSVLEHYAGETSSVPLPSFLKFDDVKELIKRLMMRTDVLVDDQVQDVVEALRLDVGYETRVEAIKHFFDRNEPEMYAFLRRILAVNNDIVLAAAISKPVIARAFLAPLSTAISRYITDRRQMCMYDYMPMGLRTMENYLEFFTALKATDFPVTALSPQGFATVLGHDALDGLKTVIIDKSLLYIYDSDYTIQRLIDLRTGCAVAINTSYRVSAIPSKRCLVVAKGDKGLVWRSDSVTPTILNISPGFTLEQPDIVGPDQSDVFIATVNKDSILHSGERYIFPSNVNVPMTITREVDYLSLGYTTEHFKRVILMTPDLVTCGDKLLVLSGYAMTVIICTCSLLPTLYRGDNSALLREYLQRDDLIGVFREFERHRVMKRIDKHPLWNTEYDTYETDKVLSRVVRDVLTAIE